MIHVSLFNILHLNKQIETDKY